MKIIRHRLIHLLVILLILGVLSSCITITVAEPAAQAASEQLTPTAGKVQANGITIAYESFGPTDRETILLIAGTGQQLVDWPIELVEELVQRGYRVVRFDNRDIGLSTKFTEAGLPDPEAIAKALEAGEPAPLPYTLQDMAGDVVGLLDALGIQQAHLAGISMGGAIAQLVAIDYPERTLSLTSLMADSGNPGLPVIARPEAFEGMPPQPTTADREAYINWQVKTWQALSGPEYPVDEAILREWAERDFERDFDPAGRLRQQTVSFVGHIESAGYRLNNLENITAPTVVLQGTEDPIVPVASAEDIVARVPGAELRLIPGLGHFIPVELVPVFADAITAAAARATSPEPTAPGQGNRLAGTSWQLVSFGLAGAETGLIEGSAITLEFSPDGRATGSGGCNSYGGEYQVQDHTLSFGPIVSTKMACADPNVMQQEQQYFQALQTAGQFELAGDHLTIRYSEGREVLNFVPAASPPPPPTTEPPERVEFAPGESSAQRGGLQPSGPGIEQYVLMANQGQTMTVDVVSDGVPLSLTIESPSGNRWIPEMRETPDGYEIGHQFTLPETGDYLVTLGKADHTPSTNYTVTFTIQ